VVATWTVLLGIITEDDVADVLQQEATEDIERLGGSEPLALPYRLASVPLLFRKRIGWLLLLFVAEAYTGTVLRRPISDELSAVGHSASSSRCSSVPAATSAARPVTLDRPRDGSRRAVAP
jgi:Mg/Co/Ni transporter MgtE